MARVPMKVTVMISDIEPVKAIIGLFKEMLLDNRISADIRNEYNDKVTTIIERSEHNVI